MNNVIY